VDRTVLFLASGFGSGYAPVAPGTAGTLVGIAIVSLLHPLPLPIYGAVSAGIFLAGVALSSRAEVILGVQDSGVIVIDEIAGFLAAMAGLPLTWKSVAAGFFLFRVLDVIKPFPIRAVERRVSGGWGVMLDDLLAGAAANMGLRLAAWVMS